MTNEKKKHKKNRHGSNAKTFDIKYKPLKPFSVNGAGVVYGKIDSWSNSFDSAKNTDG